MSAAPVVEWAEALDRFEAQLTHARAVVDDDRTPTMQAWPPPGITTDPIPATLRDRASELLRRCYELEDEIVRRRAAMNVDRRRSTVRARHTNPHASFEASL